MTDNLKSIVKVAITQSGFKAFEDYENVDTLDYPEDCLGFYSLKDCELSRWVRSLDCKTYATEMSGRLSIRLVGKRGIFDDHAKLEELMGNVISRLALSSQLIVSSVSKGEITENEVLGRLEGHISLNVKALITVGSLWEGVE